MKISSSSLFLSLVLFFNFIFITQAKEDTNTLLVDAGAGYNSIKMVSFPIDIGTPKNSNYMQKSFISFFFLKEKN
ncbi:hypothetical protein WN944_023535 [Citrus x changshan-huyou]|uniref:Uncharacterized protein n=1 Tax=Citrus x changshan-huyou TaxID=2935761 RepID=A0AAP0R1A0_9ROSI